MTFEEFYKKNTQYTYLLAKIYYNLMQEKQNKDSLLHLHTASYNEDICDSCSA